MSLKWNKILIKTGITILVIGLIITLICIPVMMKDKIIDTANKSKTFTWPITHLVVKNAGIN